MKLRRVWMHYCALLHKTLGISVWLCTTTQNTWYFDFDCALLHKTLGISILTVHYYPKHFVFPLATSSLAESHFFTAVSKVTNNSTSLHHIYFLDDFERAICFSVFGFWLGALFFWTCIPVFSFRSYITSVLCSPYSIASFTQTLYHHFIYVFRVTKALASIRLEQISVPGSASLDQRPWIFEALLFPVLPDCRKGIAFWKVPRGRSFLFLVMANFFLHVGQQYKWNALSLNSNSGDGNALQSYMVPALSILLIRLINSSFLVVVCHRHWKWFGNRWQDAGGRSRRKLKLCGRFNLCLPYKGAHL